MTNDDIINAVFQYEGGFVNDPADHGGATNFGITAAVLGQWRNLGQPATVEEVKSLTRAEAKRIYIQQYIVAPGFDPIAHGKLKWVLVDTGVLHGTDTAIKFLQQALGVTVDGVMGAQTLKALKGPAVSGAADKVLALRIQRYAAIVTRDNSQLRFLQGWINRATSILAA